MTRLHLQRTSQFAIWLAAAFIAIIAISPHAIARQKQVGYLGKGKDLYSVFVFGDELAGGLWAGTARMAKNHTRLKLNGRYREGSGLAKPNIYNWPQRLPRTLENRQIDIAIVFIGTNDAQDIRRNGEYLVFNSQPWRDAYTNAVATMMSQLTENQTAVYWLEVPPVANSQKDDRLKIIAAIHRQQAAKAGIRFVEIRKEFTTADSKYTAIGAGVGGGVVRLRARNGIRFIRNGNDKLASIVLKQIDRDIAIADGDTPATDFPVPDVNKIATNVAGPYVGPIFGSAGTAGKFNIVRPENMPVAGADSSSNVLIAVKNPGTTSVKSSDSVINDLRSQVSKDSPAFALFNSGKWPDPKPGRVDNFTQSEK